MSNALHLLMQDDKVNHFSMTKSATEEAIHRHGQRNDQCLPIFGLGGGGQSTGFLKGIRNVRLVVAQLCISVVAIVVTNKSIGGSGRGCGGLPRQQSGVAGLHC